jgi:beta-glucosidase
MRLIHVLGVFLWMRACIWTFCPRFWGVFVDGPGIRAEIIIFVIKLITCMKRILLLTLALVVVAACQSPQKKAEKRAQAILKQLTLEEKASLMVYNSPAVERLDIKSYNWWNEALHGVGRNGSATVFPMPIAMAASFDESLLEEVFTAVSDEARIKHKLATESGWYQGLTFWTPNINIFRDPRWGRGMETYGEDPYLTGVMGMAVVRGLQGDPASPVKKLHACAKHLAVHSGTEKNRHQFDANISERDLRETYLPAFKDLVTKAGVEEVMTAYNRFRGVPCGANSYLVNDILRGEWGFKGMVVSDCWALDDFYMEGRHGYLKTGAETAAAAVKNGVDLECGEAYKYIPEAVAQGLLEPADLDKAVLKILTERILLGEMDGVSPWDNLDSTLVEGPEHRALSRLMAGETMVLLQNNGILPLQGTERIALVGPNANDEEMMWGNYNPVPNNTITLLEAIQERIPGIKYVKGCGIVDGLEKNVKGQLADADIVIFAGGISPRFEGEEMPVEVPGFEGGDRTDIELPAVQRQLLQELKSAGKKVILVNFSGSAMGLVPETQSCDAILQAWYPGQEGGPAIADILFGDVNPSGKLPVTFYKSVADLPDVEDYNMEGHTYRYFRGEPLYPFGYGLSYTTFEYGEASVKDGALEIPVTNTGARNGSEVVQLYVSRPADAEGPIKTLRGFCRVNVPAGETVTASIPLTDDTFTWWDDAAQDMRPLRGEYKLLYGGSSADLKSLDYKY